MRTGAGGGDGKPKEHAVLDERGDPGDRRPAALRVSVSATGLSSAPGVGLAYLGPAGELLDTVRLLRLPRDTAGLTTLTKAVTVPAGVAEVRVVLFGFAAGDLRTAGTVTFDDVGLYGP